MLQRILMPLALIGLAQAGSSHRSVEPVLTKAVLFTHTNDDDKDHDTCIYVKATTSDGQTLIAHADKRECSSDASTHYDDNSDHQFALDIDADGLDKSATKGFNVALSQETHGGAGHDTWKFNARLVLYFSDKSNFTAQIDSATMVNNGGHVEFSQR
ncbi:MAG TPA: hypothetical protein VGM82_00205 [Gemmatimonadaceae bacterium]|jgi:hypothetical protein